ncbi:hypothetical protein XF36_20135 [Pseudonocardia sp. HH130629-09]|nr:hypothetical protein XF36_20135 [Pseudonocardia sp. HH130629-09]
MTVRPRRAAAGPELASRRDQRRTYLGAVRSGRRHLLLAGVWDADTALTSLLFGGPSCVSSVRRPTSP